MIGVSFDTPEENRAFAEAQNFPFRLLSDVDRRVGEAYDAKKGPDEQWPDFARRVTILIDPQGKVAKTYTVSDVKAHPDEVLADVSSLAGG